jgi:hypothetical protein
VGQQKGSLNILIPAGCFSDKRFWDCELKLTSAILDPSKLQYFGIRARTLSRTELKEVAVYMGVDGPGDWRSGFGWTFTDQALAFFQSIPELPEKEFTAPIAVDMNWHAYEILRDPLNGNYSYYVDGQLVGTFTPEHAMEWKQAPLQFTIYSMNGKGNDPAGTGINDTQFELDEVVIGGFANR